MERQKPLGLGFELWGSELGCRGVGVFEHKD